MNPGRHARKTAIFLLIVIVAFLAKADTATQDPVFAQSCAASNRDAQGSFPDACDGTYPSACGSGGDLLSCNDGNTETHATQSGDFAGVQVTSFNTSVTNCESIQTVRLCFEWWRGFTQSIGNCNISVDTDGGGSHTTVSTSCPGTTSNPGITCVDITSSETWACSNFFGSSGTRAQARMEAEKTQGQGGPGTIFMDALFFNVTYNLPDTTPPNVTLNKPANDSFDLDGNVTFNYTPSDETGLSNCTLFINGAANQTNTSPSNGVPNVFQLNNMADGAYNWNVSCIDTSDNIGASSTWIIRIDTTPPVVNLESPPNDNVSSTSEVTFFYNASDIMSTLASCELIIDDSVKNTANSPAEDTTLNFTASLSNGQHQWQVNCTDSNGFEGASETRNITINVTLPLVVSDKTTYTLGETVFVTGENWNPNVELTFNYTLPNGSSIIHTNNTNNTGETTDTLFINWTYPTGTYNLLAYQTNDTTENDTTSFQVNLPPTTITADKAAYGQGDEVTLTGSSFSPDSIINITFTFNDSSTDSFTATSNSTGGFMVMRNLSYTTATGLANVTAIDTLRSDINATTNFTVELRVATVITDKTVYGRNEDVNISGFNFTHSGTAEVAIYDNTTGDIGPSFPVNVSSDDSGEFSTLWDTGDTCNGVYRVEAVDNTHSFLNDTVFFNISEITETRDNTTPSAGAESEDGALNVGDVNESDNVYATQTEGGGPGGSIFYELNFTNNFKEGIQVLSVIWQIEHSETVGYGNPRIQWYNSTTYEAVTCNGLSASTSDVNQTCNLTTQIDTRDKLNNVSVRFLLDKTEGGSQTSNVDFTQLRITTGFEPACTYFNGSSGGGLQEGEPVITDVLVEDDIFSPANEIDLNAGTTKTVLCNVTVEDSDGTGDITGVNATFFSDSVPAGSPDDNLTHYTNSSCDLDRTLDSITAVYNCTFSVTYYAENNTWTCRAEATDGNTIASNSDTAFVNQLFALNISTDLVNYGSVQQEQTSAEQEVNITNFGNVPINVSVFGYGGDNRTAGINLAMTCLSNNITIDNERFSLAQAVAFTSKNQINSSFRDMGFTIQSQNDSQVVQNSTYWQIFVPFLSPPLTDGEQCDGTLVFQAESP